MSSIDNAQALQGYQRANQRPACANCAHGSDDDSHGCPAWTCLVGDFRVNAMAICARHEPRHAALAAQGYRLGGVHPSGHIRLCQACARVERRDDGLRCALADAPVKPNAHCDRFARAPAGTAESR